MAIVKRSSYEVMTAKRSRERKMIKPGRKTPKALGPSGEETGSSVHLLAPEDIAIQDNVDVCHNHPDMLRED